MDYYSAIVQVQELSDTTSKGTIKIADMEFQMSLSPTMVLN